MSESKIERGRKTRAEVLGAQYVAKADAVIDDFIRPFRELVAEYVWDSVWNRPGLDRRTRFLLNIGMLTALGKTGELKLYFDAMDNVGVTKADVQEVLLQAAVYCGVPSALAAFNVAQEKFAQK